MPLKAPPPVVVSDWTGFYVGVQFGAKWKKDDWNTTCIDAGGGLLGQCGSALSLIAFPGAPDATRSPSFSTSGFRWGFYAGFNYQLTQSWVAGVDVDWAQYNQSASVPFIPGCATAACTGGAFGPGPFFGDSTTLTNKWDGALRGRLGFLVTPDLMIYGAGGLAFQRIEESMVCNGATGAGACFIGILAETQKTTLTGWTAGGGLEWRLWQNWLLRAEYRYSEFEDRGKLFFFNSGQVQVHADIKVRSQIATLGVAYKFGPGGTVVAKY
jgi:outer membrane immunogenic protein